MGRDPGDIKTRSSMLLHLENGYNQKAGATLPGKIGLPTNLLAKLCPLSQLLLTLYFICPSSYTALPGLAPHGCRNIPSASRFTCEFFLVIPLAVYF